MRDFLRTIAGRKFIEGDIPRIASALEKIAAQLEQENIRENKRFLFEQKMAKKNFNLLNEDKDSKDNG